MFKISFPRILSQLTVLLILYKFFIIHTRYVALLPVGAKIEERLLGSNNFQTAMLDVLEDIEEVKQNQKFMFLTFLVEIKTILLVNFRPLLTNSSQKWRY